MEAAKYRLQETIHSGKGTVYAVKGEIVTLVSDRGEALIVERKNGDRVPVGKSKVEPL